MIHTYLRRPQPRCLGRDNFGPGSMCTPAVTAVAGADNALQSSLRSVMEIRPRFRLARIGRHANRRAGLLHLPRELEMTKASSLWRTVATALLALTERSTGLRDPRDVPASLRSQPATLGASSSCDGLATEIRRFKLTGTTATRNSDLRQSALSVTPTDGVRRTE